MVEILNRCNYLIGALRDCDDIQNRTSCMHCLSNSFYAQNRDTYDCLKKLCHYTINYGPIYVSEIYHFLVQSSFLRDFIQQQRQYIKNNPQFGFNVYTQDQMIPVQLNIMSLGCGFGPDDIALNKYRDAYLDWNVYFNYYGYDKEPLWNFITQSNALPITHDLLNGMNFQNINIIFMNKFFSTLYKHGLHMSFLNVLQQEFNNLPSGSYVVFNDRNVLDETEKSATSGSFHPAMMSNGSFRLVNKYFFNVPRKAANGEDKYPMNYNNSYTAIVPAINICNTPDGLILQPMPDATQAVFFLYQKV